MTQDARYGQKGPKRMEKSVGGMIEAFRGFSRDSQRRVFAAMDRMNREDWTAELLKRGERPESLADLPTGELARRLVSLE